MKDADGRPVRGQTDTPEISLASRRLLPEATGTLWNKAWSLLARLEWFGASTSSFKGQNKLRRTIGSFTSSRTQETFRDFCDRREFLLGTSLKSPRVKELSDASGFLYEVVSSPVIGRVQDLTGLLPTVCAHFKDSCNDGA